MATNETHLPLKLAMIDYETGCPQRIQHFLKVHSFASTIAEMEGLDPVTRFTLEAAALIHDIGIRPSLAKYGSSAGRHQEELGPAPAEEMLSRLGYPRALIERVARLVGRHHTYTGIDGPDCQILIEADFLVNMLEEGMSLQAIRAAYGKVFATESGRRLCRAMFPDAEREAAAGDGGEGERGAKAAGEAAGAA
ncbi:MAG: HD domain-containing protein [Deltaproteobacteria bacterium]|jgi:HD superfamily phosphodiesterase|nr:HD domain-containing protein [Deltaproteobacteria bacterium]